MALAVQGPTSYSVLSAAGINGLDKLKLFGILHTELNGFKVMVSRTGYTGDLGYELWTEPVNGLMLWDAIFSVKESGLYDVRAIGLAALEMVRIEAGFIMPGDDFNTAETTIRAGHDRSPFEIGLGWAVNFDKPQFTGKKALQEEKGSVNFSSKGDTVFFVEVDTSLEKTVTHRISLDMEKMPVKTKASFEYKTERSVDAPVSQISLIHDLKTNMLLVSKSPVSSAIPQSFNPEAWDSQLHKYPEYLFDGFPATISMESFDAGIQFRIEEGVERAKQTPFIEMVSPSEPSQKFKMYFIRIQSWNGSG